MFNSTFNQLKTKNMNNSTKTTTTSSVLSSQLQQSQTGLLAIETKTGSSPGRTRLSNFSKWGVAIMILFLSFVVSAQMNYNYTFLATGTSGWTGNGSRTTNSVCQTTGSIRYNLWSSTPTMNFVSPALVSQGQLVTMTYFTKCTPYSSTTTSAAANTLNTQVQWSTSTTKSTRMVILS